MIKVCPLAWYRLRTLQFTYVSLPGIEWVNYEFFFFTTEKNILINANQFSRYGMDILEFTYASLLGTVANYN